MLSVCFFIDVANTSQASITITLQDFFSRVSLILKLLYLPKSVSSFQTNTKTQKAPLCIYQVWIL